MNRLDEIEATWSENEDWARELDLGESIIMAEDVRALVAVARAADKRRRVRMKMAQVTGAEWERLHLHDAAEADIELDAALAPLLEQTSADAGEGR